jgi:hypothetical protein
MYYYSWAARRSAGRINMDINIDEDSETNSLSVPDSKIVAKI